MPVEIVADPTQAKTDGVLPRKETAGEGLVDDGYGSAFICIEVVEIPSIDKSSVEGLEKPRAYVVEVDGRIGIRVWIVFTFYLEIDPAAAPAAVSPAPVDKQPLRILLRAGARIRCAPAE